MIDIPIQPERIDTLSPSQAVAFSQTFEHDWKAILAAHQLKEAGGDEIKIKNIDSNPNLPSGYEQFLDPIRIITNHELSVRGMRRVIASTLTIRQQEVSLGKSQMDGICIGFAHRDLPPTTPARFYAVSDIEPTEYAPSLSETKDEVWIPEDTPLVQFSPYDITVSSAATYHRSPPLSQDAIRTFLRVTYIYAR